MVADGSVDVGVGADAGAGVHVATHAPSPCSVCLSRYELSRDVSPCGDGDRRRRSCTPACHWYLKPTYRSCLIVSRVNP